MTTAVLQQAAFTRLPERFYRAVQPEPLRENVRLVACNRALADELALPENWFDDAAHIACLAGNAAEYVPAPVASVYGGHQFGVWAGQLGDGRALLLGESRDRAGQMQEWQLKGAGKTPYSRFADGRAVLRSSVREYLCSEAMHGLGIATTRALALVGSSDAVWREQVETAAVLTRIAPSFIRFGHFQHWLMRGDDAALRSLADFVVQQYFPECAQADNPYLALFQCISRRTAELVAAWQSVGFCHGVMNTDNMSVLGLTIDYGPFGFLDRYDRRHICNHSDHHGRYAYKNQPYIAHWNTAQLAACFSGLADEADLQAELDAFPTHFQQEYIGRMRAKLGLAVPQRDDAELIDALFAALQEMQPDFTLFFRCLGDLDSAHDAPLPVQLAALLPDTLPRAFTLWLGQYRRRLRMENRTHAERRAAMNRVNPLYVLRNYLLQQAIALAEQGDFREIARLQECMRNPFDERTAFADFAQQAPDWAGDICVSCSS